MGPNYPIAQGMYRLYTNNNTPYTPRYTHPHLQMRACDHWGVAEAGVHHGHPAAEGKQVQVNMHGADGLGVPPGIQRWDVHHPAQIPLHLLHLLECRNLMLTQR